MTEFIEKSTDNGEAELANELEDAVVRHEGCPKPRKPDPYMVYLYDQRARERRCLPRITFEQWQEDRALHA